MRILTVISTIAAAGLLAACGGDDDVSDEDFVAQVTEACDATGEEVAALESEFTGATSEEEITALIQDELVPVFDGLRDNLEAVDVPEDKQDDYDQLIDLAAEQSEIVSEDPTAILDATSEGAERSQEITEEANDLSESLGLPSDCGDPGGASGATGEA